MRGSPRAPIRTKLERKCEAVQFGRITGFQGLVALIGYEPAAKLLATAFRKSVILRAIGIFTRPQLK